MSAFAAAAERISQNSQAPQRKPCQELGAHQLMQLAEHAYHFQDGFLLDLLDVIQAMCFLD